MRNAGNKIGDNGTPMNTTARNMRSVVMSLVVYPVFCASADVLK